MVSVVVPIYSMELYLERCIQSLTNQTYTDYEILLVDDGSTDRSAEICERCVIQYDNIHVLHKNNGGLSSSRNAGIGLAHGQYIIFPDPDDWVDPRYLEILVNDIETSGADLASCGFYDAYDDIVSEGCGSYPRIVLSGKEAETVLFRGPRVYGFAWNKLYKISIIRDHQLTFRDDVGITEDLYFAYDYIKLSNSICCNLETKLYYYYQRQGAATHSAFSIKKLQSLRTYEHIADNSLFDEVILIVREEECNYAMNLLWEYENSSAKRRDIKKTLMADIYNNLLIYIRSRHYGVSRKLQAVLAVTLPTLYARIKNKCTKGDRL